MGFHFVRWRESLVTLFDGFDHIVGELADNVIEAVKERNETLPPSHKVETH